jgi:hypothetical protein
MHLQHRELGDVIKQLIEAGVWSPDEQALLDLAHPALLGYPLSIRQMLLYYWLRHLSANLTKSQRFAHHPIWVVKNFEGVIKCL